MKILCRSNSNMKLQAGQQVNRIGKYLYKHIDGAFNIKYSGNTCDVYMLILYQIPPEFLSKYKITEDKYKECYEMTININITTYQNKIRINLIEVTPEEKTIGFDVYLPEEVEDLQKAFNRIYSRTCKRIEKEFKDYEFLF